MHFRLSYITRDFYFGDAEIKVTDPDKAIEIIYKKRPDEGDRPPHEKNDGLIVATCQRELTERLHKEAVDSGVLSRNKEAVQRVYDDMVDAAQRTLRLARWKTNAVGGPNPIRSTTVEYFVWSIDGSNWKRVSDAVFGKLTLSQIDRDWTSFDAKFLQTEFLKGTTEPLGHELLREAEVNRQSNPRSSLVLGVAAAEVGFKQFVSKTLTDTAWLLELPSPPLVDMIHKFPWEQLRLRINDKVPTAPETITAELKKAVMLRNKVIHSGTVDLTGDTLESILNTVKHFLYFLDVLRGSGHLWPLDFIDRELIKPFLKD
jgi:hypothetical protein